MDVSDTGGRIAAILGITAHGDSKIARWSMVAFGTPLLFLFSLIVSQARAEAPASSAAETRLSFVNDVLPVLTK